MHDVPPELADHPDRLRWNAKYGTGGSFVAHPLAERALAMPLPAGPVLDLACGTSGSGLLAAAAGRAVTAVDIAEVALDLLDQEARRRGLRELITIVHADLGTWRPQPDGYALVLCTGFWDQNVFTAAAGAVAVGGVLGWEAFTTDARRARPQLPAAWCLNPGEPASLLPPGCTVVDQHDLPDSAKRQLLATRDYAD